MMSVRRLRSVADIARQLPAIQNLIRFQTSSSTVSCNVDKESTRSIIGMYTPVTKQLWQQRLQWDSESLASAKAQEDFIDKPSEVSQVIYDFSNDNMLQEHYRNPWNGVRIGRILEDMDSMAGFVAYNHCNDSDPNTLPPVLVTATVERIHMSHIPLKLSEDMTLSGRVLWTGRSSLDIQVELRQGSNTAMVALFTFVARRLSDGKSQRINRVVPLNEEDKILFEQRKKVSDDRKAERERLKQTGQKWTLEQQQWAQDLLQQARIKIDLPSLADPFTLLTTETSMENTFSTQPQQRNMHKSIFGGFLMRRAFELAHSTAYVLAGSRPFTVMVDEIMFKKPVEIGDLLRFTSTVLHCWSQCDDTPNKYIDSGGIQNKVNTGNGGQYMVHVQVKASVIKPEKCVSYETNTFHFIFAVGGGAMKKILPVTEEQALDICNFYGPGR